VEVSVLD